MSADGWRAVKRLGVQSLSCDNCKGRVLLNLSPRGGFVGLGHWRVEQRLRAAGVGSWATRMFIACSQECARVIAAAKDAEHDRTMPKMRFSVHGPYTEEET